MRIGARWAQLDAIENRVQVIENRMSTVHFDIGHADDIMEMQQSIINLGVQLKRLEAIFDVQQTALANEEKTIENECKEEEPVVTGSPNGALPGGACSPGGWFECGAASVHAPGHDAKDGSMSDLANTGNAEFKCTSQVMNDRTKKKKKTRHKATCHGVSEETTTGEHSWAELKSTLKVPLECAKQSKKKRKGRENNAELQCTLQLLKDPTHEEEKDGSQFEAFLDALDRGAAASGEATAMVERAIGWPETGCAPAGRAS